MLSCRNESPTVVRVKTETKKEADLNVKENSTLAKEPNENLLTDTVRLEEPQSKKDLKLQAEPEKADTHITKVIKKERSKVIKPGKPKIAFEKTNHNFGTIKQGDVIEYNFRFINTGSAPLIIKNATATCGCTQPSYPFLPIEPNEKGAIGVRYNSKGKLGSQKPIITVTTNSKPSIIKLHLEGVVLAGEAAAEGK
jgi:hypothetical protein